MKKRILPLLLTLVMVCCLIPSGIWTAQAAFPKHIQSAGLPVLDIRINTTVNYLHLSKNNAATGGEVKLYSATGQQKVSVALEQMKGRGNASWAMAGDKRSYNVKCAQPVELIGGAGAGKNWVLVANNVIWDTADRTGLGNMAAQLLYQQMGGASALSCQPVDLYINEDYRGTYLLLEKVEIQENRVNITKAKMTMDENYDHLRLVDAETESTSAAEKALLSRGIKQFRYAPGSKVQSDGGFILEADNRYLQNNHDYGDKGAGTFFVTAHGAQIVVKEPEFCSMAQLTKIANYVQDFEDALYNRTGYNADGKYYSEYVDLSSLAKRVLLDCVTGQLDVFKTSCYFYIDGDNNGLKGKLITGPAWDYDNLDLETKKLYSTKDKTWEAGARNWFAQLMTKGGFVDLLYDMNKDTLTPLLNTMVNQTLGTLREQQMASQKISDVIWKSSSDFEKRHDYPTLSQTFIKRFENRVNLWNTSVWSKDHLMGVTLSVKSGTITAQVNGTGKVEWFRVNADDPTSHTSMGVTGTTYTPKEKGTYFVTVRGTSLGSGRRYGGSSNATAGEIMYSSVVHIGCIHSLSKVEAVPATCWESGAAAYWTCKQCGTLFADAQGEVTISAPKTTAPTGKHVWDNGTVTLAAACDDTGIQTYNCKNCTATKITILPKDPNAPPRKVAIKTEDDKVIIGDADQGTVIKPGSASSDKTGQNEDGSVILAPGTSMEDLKDPVNSVPDNPKGPTTSDGDADADDPADTSSEDDGSDGDADADTDSSGGGTVVTRPADGTDDTQADAQGASHTTEIIIVVVAIAACLGVLAPLTVLAIRAKKKQDLLDEAYEAALEAEREAEQE